MGVVTEILDTVDRAVDTVAGAGYLALAAPVGKVIATGSVVLIIILGINIVMQIRPMTMGSFFAFAVKLGLVTIFATTWDNFRVIYDVIVEVPQNIGAFLLGIVGSKSDTASSDTDLYAALDGMITRITAYGDTIGERAGWVFGAFLGVVVWVISCLFAAVASGIIAFGRIMLTIMVAIAPIMIMASLFKPTQQIFESWSRSIIGYAMMPIAAAGAVGIIVAVADAIASDSPDPSKVNILAEIFSFVVVLFLGIGVMGSVPNIAMGLSGAVGLASNAAGLTGLAKKGVVGAGKGAAGAAASGYRGVQNALNKPDAHGNSVASVVTAAINPSAIARQVMEMRKK